MIESIDSRFLKPVPIPLKNIADFNEAKLKDIIVDDPSILGLGNLKVKNIEKIQPGAGRLDLLLYDPDDEEVRYEVELQLGKTDESHIIRCLEYWDIERKRYPTYDHTAVLVAEDVTSRFLNVISLFNGSIPLIALRLTTLQFNDKIVLSFTKVLDKVVQEDEVVEQEAVDRSFWIKRSQEEFVSLVDANAPSLKSILGEVSPTISLKYNEQYIGTQINGISRIFASFIPKKSYVQVNAKLMDPVRLEYWHTVIDDAGFATKKSNVWLSFSLKTRNEVKDLHNKLHDLFKEAYEQYNS